MSEVGAEAMKSIHSELEELEMTLKGYAALVSAVRYAERRMKIEMKDFTEQKKIEVVDCLRDAATEFQDFQVGKMIAPGDIENKLARVLAKLEATAAYVEPARTPAVARKDDKDDHFEVVSREEIEGRTTGDRTVIEIRKYDDSNPRGMYQKWVDRKFDRTLPDYKLPARAEMKALLARMKAACI